MRLKMLASFAGADFSINRGEETDRFSADEGKRLIAAGYAELVTEQPIERAVVQPVKERRGKGKRANVVSHDA